MAEPFPWDEAMRFGFGMMGLSPDAFWSLTPRELDAAMRAFAPQAEGLPGRSWLEGAMRNHPDKINTKEKPGANRGR